MSPAGWLPVFEIMNVNLEKSPLRIDIFMLARFASSISLIGGAAQIDNQVRTKPVTKVLVPK
jgi:hypothetical protein